MTDMFEEEVRCPRCQSLMKQTGSMNGKTQYGCAFCGNTKLIDIPIEKNLNYWNTRAALLTRVRNGILDWQVTNWNQLRKDIFDFIGRYEEARSDVYFKISIVACITEGYHVLNADRYKEAKAIFRLTEKQYKLETKNLKQATDPEMSRAMVEYEEFRNLYRQCRSEYRNKKIYWKILTFFFKTLIFK